MPVKKKASKATVEREVMETLAAMEERATERFQYAMKIIDLNSDELEAAVERMADMMGQMAGEPQFSIRGIPVKPETVLSIRRKMHTWIAVRLLVACAKWDIRIANFTLPQDSCADCGAPIRERRKKK